MKILLFIVIAYFLGAIPNGIWVGKYFKDTDIRKYGSHNSGATNAYRILGAKYGMLVLVLDALKGFLPPCLAYLSGVDGNALILIGLVAILGHSLSIFLKFKGGKGVATSLGVFLFLLPKVTLGLLVIFAIIVYTTKYISLGSIVASTLLPILTSISHLSYGITRLPIMIMTTLVAVFVVYKHRTNIERLLGGRENKFKL